MFEGQLRMGIYTVWISCWNNQNENVQNMHSQPLNIKIQTKDFNGRASEETFCLY
jgi:hypothetical protein